MAKDDSQFRTLPIAGVIALFLLSRRADDENGDGSNGGNGDTGNGDGNGGGGTTPQGPTADFTSVVEPRDNPDTSALHLDASPSTPGDAEIVSYNWSIPGVIIVNQGVTYAAALEYGDYEVTLTVEDSNQLTDSITRTVTVNDPGDGGGGGTTNSPPSADFGWTVEPHSTEGSSALHLDASPTTDPDGDITEYRWTVRRDGSLAGTHIGQTYAVLLSHDTYDVFLTVEDAAGHEVEVHKVVEVGGSGGGGGDTLNAVATASVVGSDLVLDASDSTGDVNSWNWSVYDPTGTLVADRSTEVTTIENVASGTYEVNLSITSSSGGFDTDSTSVTVEVSGGGGSLDHTGLVQALDADLNESNVPIILGASDGIQAVSGPAEGQSGTLISWDAAGGEPVEFAFSGEIDTLRWQNAPLRLEINGTRRDPFEVAIDAGTQGFTPQVYDLSGSGSQVFEQTIYTSQQVYDGLGWAPARTIAANISGSLQHHGINHNIIYEVGPITTPSHDVSCPNGTPVAYDYWRELLDGTPLQGSSGDTFVQRRDSNLMLTTSPGGGCASVGGNVAVSGVQGLGSFIPWDGPEASGTDSDTIRVYAAMHEMGHNLGYAHNSGGGQGHYEGTDWHATPCSQHPGTTNLCGVDIPQRHNNETAFVGHLHYTDCTADLFRQNIGGGFTGNSQALSAANVSSSCGSCGMIPQMGHY